MPGTIVLKGGQPVAQLGNARPLRSNLAFYALIGVQDLLHELVADLARQVLEERDGDRFAE
jgi:hypothetical protein